jgi:hypothetical protein
MPDYNPDKERHVDHKFVVQKAWPDGVPEGGGLDAGVDTSRGTLKPDKQGRMLVRDEALAREIQQQYPRDYAVTRLRMQGPADSGHRYHFGQTPELPWKRRERLEREAREKAAAQETDTTPAGAASAGEARKTKEAQDDNLTSS